MIDRQSGDAGANRYTSAADVPKRPLPDSIEVFSLVSAFAALVRHRKPLALWPTALFVVVVGIGLFLPLSYTASASFVPQQVDGSAMSSLAGLASQFGVSVPQANAAQSPAFYADLVTSRPILEALVDSQYAVRVDSRVVRGDLASFFDIRAPVLELRREKTIRALRDHLLADFDPRTGVIAFSVRTKWRDLSFQIAKRTLALINDFNLRSRQQQAQAQRDFAESRLQRAHNELATAEDALEAFMQTNRSFAGDPQLNVRHDRLTRDLEIKQQLYLSIAQSFEQSRLESERNTPVISVVADASMPVIPDRRYLLLKGLAALMFGFLTVAGCVLIREAVQSHSRGPSELALLTTALREARTDVQSVLKKLHIRRVRVRQS